MEQASLKGPGAPAYPGLEAPFLGSLLLRPNCSTVARPALSQVLGSTKSYRKK